MRVSEIETFYLFELFVKTEAISSAKILHFRNGYYFRRFIRDFAKIAKPLTQLLQKGADWAFGEAEMEAFLTLRDALVSPPILAHPDFSKPFIVSTDASNYAVGAVLKQQRADKQHQVVAYFSRCMNKAELNYSATEKECLAVILAVNKFRPYLYGSRFTIVTDHCALCWLMHVKNPNGRLVRWSLVLQDLDFEIEYESGRKHLEADALSRAPVDPAPEQVGELFPALVGDSSTGGVSVRDLQEKEVWLQPILSCLRDPERPEVGRKTRSRARAFVLRDGVVFRRIYSNDGSEFLALVLPKALRKDVLHALHDHVTAGHLGVNKTYNKIRRRFYWPKMYAEIRNYVLSCKQCGGGKTCTQGPIGLLQPLPPTSKPFDRVGLDKLGPFLKSVDGNLHVLVLTDYATRMVFARAVPDGTAAEAAKFLVEELLVRHGPPAVLLTDQGKEFVNRTFDIAASVYGFKHKTTAPYHPQTNGLTERFNGTLARMMAAYTKDHTDWDRFLPHLVFAYNTSVHEVTGYTPYFLLHGFEPTLEIERQVCGAAVDHQFTFENVHYAQVAREIASQETSRSQQKSKERYDARRRDTQFAPGTDVWIRRKRHVLGKTEKLLPAYHGPFRIIRQTAPFDYEVEDADGKRAIINAERFKPFIHRESEDPPADHPPPTSMTASPPAPPDDSDDDDIHRLPPQLIFDRSAHQVAGDPNWSDNDGVEEPAFDFDEELGPEHDLESTAEDANTNIGVPLVPPLDPEGGTRTRSGRISKPPQWISRCAQTTL